MYVFRLHDDCSFAIEIFGFWLLVRCSTTERNVNSAPFVSQSKRGEEFVFT